MFFHFHVPPTTPEQPPEVELNSVGEPLYLVTPGGDFIINDPLLIREVPEETNQEMAGEEEVLKPIETSEIPSETPVQ